MPIQIKYLDGGLGVGIITGQDFISANKEMYASIDKMREYKYGLVDLSGVTKVNVSTSEIETIVSQDKNASNYMSELAVAVVAEKDIEFGLSRIWEALIEYHGMNWKTKIFRKRDGAEKWIKNEVKEKYQIDITLQ